MSLCLYKASPYPDPVRKQGQGALPLSAYLSTVCFASLIQFSKISLDPMFFPNSIENYDFWFVVLLVTTWKQVSYKTIKASFSWRFEYSSKSLISTGLYKCLIIFVHIFKLINIYRKSSRCMLLICTNFIYQGLVT